MTKNRIDPPLRFQEFTDTWERRKLGEIAEQVKEKNLLLVEHETFSNSAEFGIVRQMDFFDHVITNEENIGGYYIVHADDFVYNPRISVMAPVGPISRNKLGRNGIMSPLYTVFRPHDVDYNYLEYYFKTDRWYSFMRFNGDTGARSDRFSIKTNVFYEMPISIPELDEQRKIGAFLIHLNDLITLHQRKLEQQKQLKKYFLQNMFPAEGEKVPKIRFQGFTGDWEQRKIGDYYDFKNGLNKGKEYFGTGTPIVNFTDVFNNRGITSEMLKGKVNLTSSEIQNYEVKKGDIFFTRTSEIIEEIGYPSVILDSPKNTVFSGFVLRGRCFVDEDPLDNLFKKYVFFTKAFRNEMTCKSSMTTRALTSGKLIKNMEFLFPKNKVEQRKIALFLTNIDHLITLHQCKIDQLQALKKFMLQNLFV